MLPFLGVSLCNTENSPSLRNPELQLPTSFLFPGEAGVRVELQHEALTPHRDLQKGPETALSNSCCVLRTRTNHLGNRNQRWEFPKTELGWRCKRTQKALRTYCYFEKLHTVTLYFANKIQSCLLVLSCNKVEHLLCIFIVDGTYACLN